MPRKDAPYPSWSPTCVAVALAAALTLATGAFAQQPSGNFGAIAFGQAISNVLAPAPPDGITFHSYAVQLPEGLEVAYVLIDGLGNDVDLAVKIGAEIVSYDDVDFLDYSDEGNPWFVLENPAADIWYIDVFNLVDVEAPYILWVTDDPEAPLPPPTPVEEAPEDQRERPKDWERPSPGMARVPSLLT